MIDNSVEDRNNEEEFESDFISEENDAFEDAPDDKVAELAILIRDKSYEGILANAEDFLDEPMSLEVENLLEIIEELKAREEFSDICTINGKEKMYLYSEQYMTGKYAKMMVLVEENDLFKTISETVREESRIYPRPTDVRLFGKSPFKLSKEEFAEVYEQLKKNEEYKDIQETRASNNALYLYSDKFMRKAHAASLAEWIEVESEQNP